MAQQSGRAPARILIVDDHPNTAMMLARVLCRLCCPVEVYTFLSGEEALNQISCWPMDVVITDFMMPGMNGLELIQKLTFEKMATYTILITAYDTPGLSVSAKQLGVKGYFVKPVQPEKIQQIVRSVLEELRETSQTG